MSLNRYHLLLCVLALALAGPTRAAEPALTAERVTNQVSGVCGFKNAPANGTVDIAYSTFPPFENRGFATAMAVMVLRLCLNEAPAYLRRDVEGF